ncbi:camk/mapkapk/mapkapk protein kinase [Salpingoeca rosetta]|uniref:Camk/mapkapk/mapkapk protein kinase n=1 Tax=Salpingoeca rosetta (strain ATCC 50818 / BSB-021) TaxID=946362 RepID=F2U5B3_SALR5|nr:camk/mapkapk/mapkapk protein kinase [Salpingoeca rosetta]EGD83129.1 camk/mapkapk/mapkapk protein kinase [Salpingoeca rosetta]|eukprot:XP_004995493.1 camk/mapkapk/mapkapk protein kinase [Salpingoeca rosetta]
MMISENGLEEEQSYPDDTPAPVVLRRRVEDDFIVDWAHPLGAGRNVVTCRHRRTHELGVLKYMPKSDVSLHEIFMLHYCTVHCPDHVTRLIAAYENDVYFADNPHKPVRFHLIILEYMNGGTLFDHARQLGFQYTERVVSNLFRQVVECVDKIHSLNIAHRDIKPENVLLCHDGDATRVKLTDMAFAHFDRGHSMASECGTPEYQAPETQIDHPRVSRRGGFYTKACDIWSLGVTLYVLLSGTFPFQGQDVHSKLIQDYSFPPEAWDDVSQRAQAFTSTLLCAPPRLRPTTARLLDHPWLCDPDTLNNATLSAVERLGAPLRRPSIWREEQGQGEGGALVGDARVARGDDDGGDDGDAHHVNECSEGGDSGDGGITQRRQQRRRTLHTPKAPFVTMAASTQPPSRQSSQDRLSLPAKSRAAQVAREASVGTMHTNSHVIDTTLVDTCDFWESPVTTASIDE